MSVNNIYTLIRINVITILELALIVHVDHITFGLTATRKINEWIITNEICVVNILNNNSSWFVLVLQLHQQEIAAAAAAAASSAAANWFFKFSFFKFCRPVSSIVTFFNAETYAEINGKICLRFRKIIYVSFRRYKITYFYL